MLGGRSPDREGLKETNRSGPRAIAAWRSIHRRESTEMERAGAKPAQSSGTLFLVVIEWQAMPAR